LFPVILSVAACGTDDTSGDDTDTTQESTGGETTSAVDGSSGAIDTTAAETSTSAEATTVEPTSSDTGMSEAGGDSSSTGDEDEICPPPPANMLHWITGNEEDAQVTPTGPGLLMMGGGPDVDEAFVWWSDYIAGGDVVVLRASGSDGYNDYLYEDFAPVDSVETMRVTSKLQANHPYVTCRVRQAEGIFIAGGNQAVYLDVWKDTELADAIMHAWERGAIVGGTSAGLAVLGEFAFAAYNGTVYSDEALDDPYNQYMTLERDFLSFPFLQGVITDSHFADRDRMGRLVGFIARIVTDRWGDPVVGIGVEEETALVVGPDCVGEVIGLDRVYVVHSNGQPAVCEPGQLLDYTGLTLHQLDVGDTVSLPAGTTAVPGIALSAQGGLLDPANPY
jgi:cyanophycinase